MGLPGSGKTHKCLEEIKTAKKAIYLVPEQYSLQSERNIIENMPQKATTVSVLSFQRLAFRLFNSTGAPTGTFLDDVGKVMLLRKITADLRKSLNFYGKSADKQGFINGLSHTISEFYRCGVSQENLLMASETAPEAIKHKLSDLHLIYRQYAEVLRNNYFSMDEALDFLPDKISQSEDLNGAHVWVDGFYGFSVQELHVLARIIKKAEQVSITMTVNKGAVKYNPLHPYNFFYETKRAVNKITILAEEQGVKIEEPVFLHRDENSALGIFRSQYYRISPRVYQNSVDAIRVLKAYDKEAEVEESAKQIIGLLRSEGLRYRDIAVMTGDIHSYKKKINRIYALYNIPFFIDVRSDIMSHPLVELIRAAVETAAKRMAYQGVFRFLRTGLTDIPRSGVDALENYVLAYGIKGYQWFRQWEKGEGAEEAEVLRGQVLSALEDVVSGPYTKKASIREFSERIFSMLERLKIQETLSSWIEDMFVEGDNETLRRHSQIWSKICAVFDKLVETLGDSVVTIVEFGKVLDAGFSASDMGIIPPSVDQVVIGDLTRSRLPAIKALIVLGANEGMLPKPVTETSFLNDEERLYLLELGIEVGSDGKRKSNEDRFLTYVSMARPSDHLCVIYSLFDRGKEQKPASCIDTLLKIFPEVQQEDSSLDLLIRPAKPMLSKMGTLMRRHMSGLEMTAEMLDVYGLLKEHPTYNEVLSRMENAIWYSYAQRKLSRRSARRLYGPELITGASMLERYAECPFAYFMRYNLRARERRLYTVDQLDTGNLFHNVLELFSRKLNEAGESWRSLTQERINELTDICVDELSPEIPAFFSTARFTYLLKRVRRICKRSIWALSEHIKHGKFEPFGSEIAFNADSPITGIKIELEGGRSLILTGRIDRVDIFDSSGKRYVKIIDYKSGNKKFDLDDVFFGTQLQLLLYMDALIKNGRALFGDKCNMEILPGGLFYFNINDPIVDEQKVDGALEERLLECFKLSGLILKDKEVVEAMDGSFDGESAVIPVVIRKSDGVFGTRSSTVGSNEFNELRATVEEKITLFGSEILSGNIAVYPYKKGSITACDYCIFSAVCAIEADDRPDKFNVY